jgi:hypothetical protein
MPQHLIRTTATLATLLAFSSRAPAMENPESQCNHQATPDLPVEKCSRTQFMDLAGYLIAINVSGSLIPQSVIDVSFAIDPFQKEPSEIMVWVGRKNAWGSVVSEAEPSISSYFPGVFTVFVTIPDSLSPTARLWLALFDDTGHCHKGSVPLPV